MGGHNNIGNLLARWRCLYPKNDSGLGEVLLELGLSLSISRPRSRSCANAGRSRMRSSAQRMPSARLPLHQRLSVAPRARSPDCHRIAAERPAAPRQGGDSSPRLQPCAGGRPPLFDPCQPPLRETQSNKSSPQPRGWQIAEAVPARNCLCRITQIVSGQHLLRVAARRGRPLPWWLQTARPASLHNKPTVGGPVNRLRTNSPGTVRQLTACSSAAPAMARASAAR